MKSLARAWLLSVTLVLLVACGGGSADVTPTRSPQPTETPAPEADVPPRPSAFADYPAAVGTYLSSAGSSVLGPPCLSELIEAWSMPEPDAPLTPEERCLAGNTDADHDDEVAVLFTAEPEGANQFGLLSNVVVFDRGDAGYRVAFQSWKATQFPEAFPQTIAAAEDVTGDGTGELVFTVTTCGAHTCTLAVHVLSGEDPVYRALTPEEGITMTTAELAIRDRDGDRQQELVMHGGTIGSVGAGPQRARTEVYAWNGSVYDLIETSYEASNLRYFKMLDADAAFAGGDYQEAARLYEDALGGGLEEVEGFGSRDELLAYANFRVGLSQLQLGDPTTASQAIETAIARYPVSMTGRAAVEFRNTVNLSEAGYSGDLSDGCAAVAASLNSDAARFEEAWYYGYSNPQLETDQVCPF